LYKYSDIIIIGGGIAGLSTCYWLTKLGYKPLLIEQGELGHGATWAAAGMLAPVHELEYTELPLLQAGLASQNLYNEWERELGDIGVNRNGTLEVALTTDDVPYLQRHYDFQRQQGLQVQWLAGSALQVLEPALSPALPVGIFSPHDIQVDNRMLPAALAAYCTAQGATLHIQEIFLSYTVEGGTLQVTTDKGSYKTDKLLLATGVLTPEGIVLPEKIIPVKGQMLSLAPPAGGLLQKTVRIRSRALGNAYLVPKRERIVLGSTTEEMGSDSQLTAGAMLDILRKCYAAVPGLYDLPVLETWSGLRPATANRLPFATRHPTHEVYYLNGLYRHGILLGPLMGQAAAQLIHKGTLPDVVAALHSA